MLVFSGMYRPETRSHGMVAAVEEVAGGRGEGKGARATREVSRAQRDARQMLLNAF